MSETNNDFTHGNGKINTDKAKKFSLKGSLKSLEHQHYFKPKPKITPEQVEQLKTHNVNTIEVTPLDVNKTVFQVGILLMEQINAIHKKIAEVVPDLKTNYILQTYPHHYIELPDGDGSINLYQRIIHKRQDELEAGQGPTLEQMVFILGDKQIYRDETGWYIRAHIHLGIPKEALDRVPIGNPDTPTSPIIDQPEALDVPVEDLSPLPEEVPIARPE